MKIVWPSRNIHTRMVKNEHAIIKRGVRLDKRKILFADDDPEIREVVRILLESEGYQVVEAENGEQADVCGRRYILT